MNAIPAQSSSNLASFVKSAALPIVDTIKKVEGHCNTLASDLIDMLAEHLEVPGPLQKGSSIKEFFNSLSPVKKARICLLISAFVTWSTLAATTLALFAFPSIFLLHVCIFSFFMPTLSAMSIVQSIDDGQKPPKYEYYEMTKLQSKSDTGQVIHSLP